MLYSIKLVRERALFKRIASKVIFFTTICFSCITAYAADLNGSKNILAFGDSLTAGYGLGPKDGFTVQLENKLNESGLDATVINAGVSGDTSSGGFSRLEWVLSSYQEIDLVVLCLGANDALRGINPQTTRNNIDGMMKLLTEKNIPVLLAGMVAPPNLGPKYGEEFNSIYPDMAKKYDAPLYPFFLDGVAGFIELNQADRIHPNEKGVDIITGKISPIITELLK